MEEILNIALNGLSEQRKVFHFRVGTEFFKSFGNVDVLSADVEVECELYRSGKKILVDVALEGEVTVQCDRCLDDLLIPIDEHPEFVLRNGEAPSLEEEELEDGREVLYLPFGSKDLDISQLVYDYSCLAIPLKKVHQDGECNPQVLRYISQDEMPEEDSTASFDNNPFGALKNLNFDNNK